MLELIISDQQHNLNRGNTWILKPAAKNRGEGISVKSNLNSIIETFKFNSE